jgi:predicted transcriptional regulator
MCDKTKNIEEIKKKILNQLKNDKILKGMTGFSPTEVEVIFELLYEPMSVRELADRLDVEKSTAYKSVNKLLRCNILKREKVSSSKGNGMRYVYYSDLDFFKAYIERRRRKWLITIDNFSLN